MIFSNKPKKYLKEIYPHVWKQKYSCVLLKRSCIRHDNSFNIYRHHQQDWTVTRSDLCLSSEAQKTEQFFLNFFLMFSSVYFPLVHIYNKYLTRIPVKDRPTGLSNESSRGWILERIFILKVSPPKIDTYGPEICYY